MPVIRNPETGRIRAQYPTMDWVEEICCGDNTTGWCIACGAEQDGVEPDACRYTCEACDLPYVYGASELLIQGRVKD